jgi:hypothetical protein
MRSTIIRNTKINRLGQRQGRIVVGETIVRHAEHLRAFFSRHAFAAKHASASYSAKRSPSRGLDRLTTLLDRLLAVVTGRVMQPCWQPVMVPVQQPSDRTS